MLRIYRLSMMLAVGLTTLAAALQAPPAHAKTTAGEAKMLAALQAQVARGEATSVLFFSQDQRDVFFKNMDVLLPTRHIQRGTKPLALEDAQQNFSDLTYEVEGKTYPLSHFLSERASRGFIATKDGKVLFEYYTDGHDQETKWVSFSVSKSVTSMLIGAAVQDGFIASVDEPIDHYLPRLRDTGYEGVSIQAVLRMASGLAWNEDYADPESDVSKAGGINGLPLVQYLAGLPRVAEAGAKFNYNTGETNLAGELLRSAIGNNASTYLAHKIWMPFGMGSDANWMTSGLGGGETGGCCISATLRDYVRIGMFAMADGVLADGTRVLPEGWMQDSTSPSPGADYYGYLWWLSGSKYAARGIFGQQIFLNPEQKIVIAAHSNADAAVGTEYHKHLEAVVGAFDAALSR